ncbi:hypothetical protein AB1L88_07535 [Tautonia sp. JC769]|uniref:hypothetical protein n=1 Tax=Tautonia sp. JC769 TaxID=3232135 RepID=UPI00345AE99F
MRTVQREAQRAVDNGRRAVKGQVRIRVHNATDGEMTLTASVGRQKITVDPGKTGTYTKANIGDSVIVYANGKTLKSLGILHKNVYNLTYRD